MSSVLNHVKQFSLKSVDIKVIKQCYVCFLSCLRGPGVSRTPNIILGLHITSLKPTGEKRIQLKSYGGEV